LQVFLKHEEHEQHFASKKFYVFLSNYWEAQKACRIFYEKEEVHERRKIITKLEENKKLKKVKKGL